MLIQINETTRITSDSKNIIIQKRYEKKKKPSKDVQEIDFGWKDVGYYGRLENALCALLERIANESGAETVSGLLGELERMKNEIVKAVKGGVGE